MHTYLLLFQVIKFSCTCLLEDLFCLAVLNKVLPHLFRWKILFGHKKSLNKYRKKCVENDQSQCLEWKLYNYPSSSCLFIDIQYCDDHFKRPHFGPQKIHSQIPSMAEMESQITDIIVWEKTLWRVLSVYQAMQFVMYCVAPPKWNSLCIIHLPPLQ